GQDPIRGGGVNGRLSRQFAEARHEHAIVVQRRNRRQALRLAQEKVFFAATGGNMDDAGAFLLAHLLPRDHPVKFLRWPCRTPLLFDYYSGDLGGITGGMGLGWQLIERTVISPTDHLTAQYFAHDLVATLFFKYLFQGLELGHSFDPLLLFELLLEAVRREGTLGQVVDLFAVANF